MLEQIDMTDFVCFCSYLVEAASWYTIFSVDMASVYMNQGTKDDVILIEALLNIINKHLFEKRVKT